MDGTEEKKPSAEELLNEVSTDKSPAQQVAESKSVEIETKKESEVEAKSETKDEVETEAKSETKEEFESDFKSDIKPETNAEVKTENKSPNLDNASSLSEKEKVLDALKSPSPTAAPNSDSEKPVYPHNKPVHHAHQTHHKKSRKIKINTRVVNLLLMIVIGALLIFNLSTVTNLDLSAINSGSGSEGTNLGANVGADLGTDLDATVTGVLLTATTLTANCEDCYDLSPTYDALDTLSVDLTKKEIAYDSKEGQALLEKYNISQVPAIILSGDLDSIGELAQLTKTDDVIVLPAVAPYLDVASGDVLGKVTLTYFVKSDCEECFDISLLTEQLGQFGLAVSNITTIDVSSEDGKFAIDKYGLKKVPTFMVSEGISAYGELYKVWKDLGQTLDDGSLIMEEITPPYYDFASNSVKGLVTMTNLVDASCTECYDVSLHSQILESRFGMKVGEKLNVDISSDKGKALIEKYSIVGIPTVILSSDVSEYRNILEMWNEIGSEESDGTFIFRQMDQLGQSYKNLETGEIVTGASAIGGAAVAEIPVVDSVVDETVNAEVVDPVVDEVVVNKTNSPPVLNLGLE